MIKIVIMHHYQADRYEDRWACVLFKKLQGLSRIECFSPYICGPDILSTAKDLYGGICSPGSAINVGVSYVYNWTLGVGVGGGGSYCVMRQIWLSLVNCCSLSVLSIARGSLSLCLSLWLKRGILNYEFANV